MLLKLIPFAVGTVIYFYYMPSLKPSIFSLLIKCLPIYSLAGVVYFSNVKGNKCEFAKLIFYGLISSSIGDACLVYHHLFPLGMVAFAVAHCFYIKAFGFKPLKLGTGLCLYTVAGIMLLIILPNIKDPVIFYGIPVYCLFLTTMSWRALARVTEGHDAWSWPKTFCAVGSVLFIISDTLICFHDLQNPIPYGRMLIMSTYYIAQLGIALSIKSINNKATRTARKHR